MAEHHGGVNSRSRQREVLNCWFAELKLEGASGMGKMGSQRGQRSQREEEGEWSCGCDEAEEGKVGGSVPGRGSSKLKVMCFWFMVKCAVMSVKWAQAP